MEIRPSSYVTVARVLRPHGRCGEVACEILTDFPERLKNLPTANLWDGRVAPREARVLRCWLSHSRGGQVIFHFEGSNSIADAEKLVALEVQIALADRAPLPPGSFYISDLIGCELFPADSGTERHSAETSSLGHVTDVQRIGEAVAGTPILTVQSSKGEFAVPLAEDICVYIDTHARRIEVNLPEGLLDLNS